MNPDDPYSRCDDIIRYLRRGHHTQYGRLALNMRNALPNAHYIGFTGPPLFKDDEIIKRIFGDYVSTYDFQRAVDDGTKAASADDLAQTPAGRLLPAVSGNHPGLQPGKGPHHHRRDLRGAAPVRGGA